MQSIYREIIKYSKKHDFCCINICQHTTLFSTNTQQIHTNICQGTDDRKGRKEGKKAVKYPLKYCYSCLEIYLSQMLLSQRAVFYFPEHLQTFKENCLQMEISTGFLTGWCRKDISSTEAKNWHVMERSTLDDHCKDVYHYMHRFIKMKLQTKGVAVKQKEKRKERKKQILKVSWRKTLLDTKYLAPRVRQRNWEMLSVTKT